jgi:hypothetical protein
MTGQTSNVRKRIVVENTSGRSLTFILEPWADEHPIGPGERFIVEGDGPAAYAEFTVEQTDEYLIVWAWDGSDARVLRDNGSVVWDWTGLRVPNFREP